MLMCVHVCDAALCGNTRKCGSWSLTGWPLLVYANLHPLLTSWSRNRHAAMVSQKQKRFCGKSTKHLTPMHFKSEPFWRSRVMRSKYRGQGSHTPPSSNVGSFQRHHYRSFNAPFCTSPCYLCTLFCLRFPPFVTNILPCFSGFSLRNNRSRAQGFSATQHDRDFLYLSVAYGGCGDCDVTLRRQIHVSIPTFRRSFLTQCISLYTLSPYSFLYNLTPSVCCEFHAIIQLVQDGFQVVFIQQLYSKLNNSKSTSPIDPYVFR